MSGDTAMMAFQPQYYTQPSFFEHLNYDVRQIIYQFMEGHLPPAGNSSQYAGFALSCKQAYFEVRQPAMKGLRRFLEDFQQTIQQYAATSTRIIPNIPLYSSFSQVRHITIRIPAALVMKSFDTQLDKTVVALRPILSGYFRKVTFLFVDPANEYSPNFRTAMRISSGFALYRLTQIINDEHKIQSSVKALSKYMACLSTEHEAPPRTSVQPGAQNYTHSFLQPYQNFPHPISTSDIQIAWDWRSEYEIGTPKPMHGYYHGYEQRAEPTWPQLYVMESADKTVGMQGVASKERWSVPESVRAYYLLQEQRHKSMSGNCWAEGVGRDVRRGLGNMSLEEFRERNPPLVLGALF